MNRKALERKVFQRVMEKLEGRGMFHILESPPGQDSVQGLSSYLNLDADDLAYVNDRGQLVLESVGDDATEASRRLSMLIGQVKRGSEKLGLVLNPDLRPATVRVPEVNGFVAFATFDTGATKPRREAVQWTRGSAGDDFKALHNGIALQVWDTGKGWQAEAMDEKDHSAGVNTIGTYPTEPQAKKAAEKWASRNAGEAQVSGRPFRHSEARGVEQRLPTVNQIGDSPIRQRAAEVIWVQAGQPIGVPDAAFTAYHNGYELWVIKEMSTWVALGRPEGSKGPGTTIVKGGLSFAKSSAINWAKQGGTDLSY